MMWVSLLLSLLVCILLIITCVVHGVVDGIIYRIPVLSILVIWHWVPGLIVLILVIILSVILCLIWITIYLIIILISVSLEVSVLSCISHGVVGRPTHWVHLIAFVAHWVVPSHVVVVLALVGVSLWLAIFHAVVHLFIGLRDIVSLAFVHIVSWDIKLLLVFEWLQQTISKVKHRLLLVVVLFVSANGRESAETHPKPDFLIRITSPAWALHFPPSFKLNPLSIPAQGIIKPHRLNTNQINILNITHLWIISYLILSWLISIIGRQWNTQIKGLLNSLNIIEIPVLLLQFIHFISRVLDYTYHSLSVEHWGTCTEYCLVGDVWWETGQLDELLDAHHVYFYQLTLPTVDLMPLIGLFWQLFQILIHFSGLTLHRTHQKFIFLFWRLIQILKNLFVILLFPYIQRCEPWIHQLWCDFLVVFLCVQINLHL